MSLQTLSKTATRAWRALTRASAAALLIVSFAPAFAAITFDPTPSTGGAGLTQMEIIQDSGNPALSGAYLGVRFSSNIALTNVYARAVVGGTGYSLDATEAQDHFIGDLSATAKTSYWFINYPTTGNGTLQIQIYAGNPAAGGVLQGTSTTYTVSSANADNSASANKIVSVSLVPGTVQLGQSFNLVVCYGVNSTARLLVEPASSASFDPNNLRLGNVNVDVYGSADCTGVPTATLANQLLFAGPVSSNSARATYTFQMVGLASVGLSPIVSARSGIYKYNADYAVPPPGVSYTVPAPSNRVKIAKSVNVTESSVGTTVTYTLTASNSGSADVILDDFVDTLPASPANATYVAGSSRLNGATVLSNPVISGQTLTWGNPDLSGASASSFKVPAGGLVALSFQAMLPSTNGLYTNSAIARINGNIIGSTETLGSAPATAATAIGPPSLVVTKTTATPALVNAAGGTTATYTVTVTNGGTAAAGIKVIDTLPAGFTYASTTSVTLAGSALAPAAYQVVTTGTQTPSTPQWDTNPSGGFTLAGSKTLVITFVANVAAAVADGSYDNSASTSSSTAGAVITNFNGAASSTENVTVTSAVLTVNKSTSTPTVIHTASGATATYTVSVSNSGTAAATGVTITDALPAGFTFASGSAPVLGGGATRTAVSDPAVGATAPSFGTFSIPAGGSVAITLVANIASTVADGTYDNSASATGAARMVNNFNGATQTSDNVTVTSAVLAVSKTTSTPAVTNSPSGTTASYKIVVSNSGTAAASAVKVTDTLPAGFSYASTASVTVNGSATTAYTVTGSTTPQWDSSPAGGFSVNPGQTLEIVFTAAVASNVTSGTYQNSAAATAAARSISNYDGNASSAEDVTVSVAAPSIAKTFSPNPVNINFASTLSITVTNPNASPIAALAFNDPYPSGLVNTATPAVTNTCGGSVTGGAAGGASIGLTGGTLAAGASCTVTVQVSATTVGAYVNTTTAITTTNAGTTTTGNVATQTLTVTDPAPPFIAKAFTPAVVGVNQASTLTITITNPNGAKALDGVAFNDAYPSGLMNAPVPNVTNSCGGAVTGGTATGTSIGLVSGSIVAGGSCTITVNVWSPSPGSYANTTGNVTSTTAGVGTGNTASSTLTVVPKPSVAKSFSPAAIAVGGTTTLSLTISNASTSTGLSNLALTDTFPANLVMASPNALANTCGGSVSAAPGSGTLSLSGGSVASASTCTVSVAVTSNVAGTYNNTSGGAASTESGSEGAASNTATLLVLLKPTIAKSFAPASITTSGVSTLTLVLTNPNLIALTGAAFTDAFPVNLGVAGAPSATNTCTGTFAPAAADTSIGLTGGVIPPSGSCSVSVAVASALAGSYNNTAGGVATSETGAAGTPSNTATLTVTASGVPVSGYVYSDANHNLQRDAGEAGTGLTLYAKLVPAATPAGPATQAVAVNAGTGLYQLASVSPGDYLIVVDDNATLGDVTPVSPPGWIGTEAPDNVRRNVVVAATELQNLNFGAFNGNLATGSVFADNGSGAGTAHNGVPDGAEPGIGGVVVKLTDPSGATLHGSTLTDAAGNFVLWIPAALNGSALKVSETNPSGWRSTGGNTAAGYDRTTDSYAFTYALGTNTPNLNFGDVSANTLVNDGQQTAIPGAVLFYAHTFTPASVGSLTFTATSASGWALVLLRDANCNGVLDAGEPVLAGAISTTAGAPVCVILKVSVPGGAPFNAQDRATLQANFVYTNASPALSASLTNIDTTTVGNGTAALTLLKSQDNATPLPGATISYTIVYTNNSSGTISSIRINDGTPAFTTFLSASCVLPLPAGVTACAVNSKPAIGLTGAIEWTLTGGLLPGASGQLAFAVKVD